MALSLMKMAAGRRDWMTLKIDAFAHVLLPEFFGKMLALDKNLVSKMHFVPNPVLTGMTKCRESMPDTPKHIEMM